LEDIPVDNYELRYSKSGYDARSYFFTVPFTDAGDVNDTLYLLDEGNSTTFVLTVTDKFNQPIEGSIASLLRRYVNDNNQTIYEVVEMMKPSQALDGATPFNAVANTVAYLFRVTDSDGTVLYQGSGSTSNDLSTLYLIDTQIFIKVDTASTPLTNIVELSNYQYSLTNTSADQFWFSFSDPSNVVGEQCLLVTVNNTQTLSEQCSSASSGVLSYTLPAGYNTSYYLAKVKVSNNGDTYTIAASELDYLETNVLTFGVLGLFLLVINMITFSLIFASRPAVAIIAVILAVVSYGPYMLRMVTISITMQASLFFIGLVVAYFMRDT